MSPFQDTFLEPPLWTSGFGVMFSDNYPCKLPDA